MQNKEKLSVFTLTGGTIKTSWIPGGRSWKLIKNHKKP